MWNSFLEHSFFTQLYVDWFNLPTNQSKNQFNSSAIELGFSCWEI